jgi:uncharacterized protein YbjT (DUF2867 family)
MDRTPGLVTVFGASGFVGTRLVQLLAREGYRIRAAVRRPDLAGHLPTQGMVGQVMPIQANIRNADSVMRAINGADVVINLVGIGYERGRQRFREVHVTGPEAIATAARAAGVKALVHMSALGADPESTSAYARSKAGGEEAVLRIFPEATIVRPSIMFGNGDGFFNLIGSLSRYLPVLPLIGGKTRFQPVYVGDVAEAILAGAQGKTVPGQIYELGGPEVETHRQLWERVLREAMRSNPLVPVPPSIGKLLALPFAILPFPPLLTADQVELLSADNVVSEAAEREKRTLQGLGITPVAMDAILPTYLWRFRRNGQFDRQTA